MGYEIFTVSTDAFVSLTTNPTDTKTKSSAMPRLASLMLAAMSVVANGCTHRSDIENVTHDTYAKTQHARIIDLTGASDITVHLASDIDTSDRWFSFQISRADFTALVKSVAVANNGPSEIKWADTAIIPESWQPGHAEPAWWKISPAKDYKSISWCYAAQATYHHGWYFYHESGTDTALCWHWRYQHADDMCDD